MVESREENSMKTENQLPQRCDSRVLEISMNILIHIVTTILRRKLMLNRGLNAIR